MRAVRSLHVIDRLERRLGGAMQAALEVGLHLGAAGHPAEVAGSFEPDDDLSHLDAIFGAVRVHRFLRSFPARYANSASFAQWMTRVVTDFDLVEIHTVFSAFTWRAARICANAGIPYLVRPHGSLDPFDLRKHALLKRVVGPMLVRPVLARAARVMLTAPLEAERIVTYGATVAREVVPLPVTLNLPPGDRNRFRSRHKIPSDATVVLFLSRIDYKKGLDVLIPAVGRLVPVFRGLHLVLAGSGEEAFERQVRRWVQEHALAGCTVMPGFLSGQDKADALAAADIFALPSRNENFGIVNVEAMHAGLPLVISDQVYISREIQAGGAGIVCQPNEGSVFDALRQLLDGSTDRAAMGRAGRELVRTRFHPEVATQTLLTVYDRVLGGK